MSTIACASELLPADLQLAWIYPTGDALCLQAFTRRTAELQRLAWIYPTSRMQHIVARAWQAKQEAALQAAQASEGVAVQVSRKQAGRQAVMPAQHPAVALQLSASRCARRSGRLHVR